MFGGSRWGLALVLLGCQAELSAGLDEEQADAIVIALDEAGIGAERERTDPSREPPRYRVMVARSEVPAALAVLRAHELPREREPGWASLFERSSLVPSAGEERARHAAALGGELARSLEELDGVARARVHLALPDTGARRLDGDAPQARASVLLTMRPGASADADAARALVAGAVDGLAAERVSVVITPARDAAPREPQLAWVGPIAVSRGTAALLKALLGGSLALNLLLAAALVLSRRRSARRAEGAAASPVTE
ncbi:MAG: secretion protein [Sandaracinaceae bacterium]|nr:secretion protein [Sandaracinaceae bacterium]